MKVCNKKNAKRFSISHLSLKYFLHFFSPLQIIWYPDDIIPVKVVP